MCEEKVIKYKTCKCCKKELPIIAFSKTSRSKDGYFHICKECRVKEKNINGNPKLFTFTARELIEELKTRGYTGKLEYVERHIINV